MTTNFYPKHYCGVFGVFGHPDAAMLTYYGLQGIQHRGEESAGIVSSRGDNQPFRIHRGMGLVKDVFRPGNIRYLKGRQTVGHTRYSTTGPSQMCNAQPFMGTFAGGTEVALGHNGNLVNADELKAELQHTLFTSTTDSEVILSLLGAAKASDIVEALKLTLPRLRGAYSLVLLTRDSLIGVRDPFGFRPLCIGEKDGAFFLASETSAFMPIGVKFVRDVRPGEIVVMSRSGLSAVDAFPDHTQRALCIFEFVYFAKPDSNIDGHNVHVVRTRMGQELANEHPVATDVVISIPEGGDSAALGFSEELGIRPDRGFIRNHYIGRSFLKPTQKERENDAKLKLALIPDVVRGRRVVVIDDSIVRGTTSRTRVSQIKEAGAREVHVRVSCPPHLWSCFYGVDFPDRNKLLAVRHSVEEIRAFLNADSLGYLSLEGMVRATGRSANEFCLACFNGRYPVPPDQLA